MKTLTYNVLRTKEEDRKAFKAVTSDVRFAELLDRVDQEFGEYYDKDGRPLGRAADVVAGWIANNVPINLTFKKADGSTREMRALIVFELPDGYHAWKASMVESGQIRPTGQKAAHKYGNVKVLDLEILDDTMAEGFPAEPAIEASWRSVKVARIRTLERLTFYDNL